MSSPPSDASGAIAAGSPPAGQEIGTPAPGRRSPWTSFPARVRRGLQGSADVLLDGAEAIDLATGTRHATFEHWCAASRASSCRLWLTEAGLSDLVCAPAGPLPAARERLAWARRVFMHYHGRPAQQWPLASWQWGGALGVSALRTEAPSSWHAAAEAAGMRIVSLRPLWTVWAHRLLAERPDLRRAPLADLLLFDTQGNSPVLTLVQLAHGQPTAIVRRRLDPDVSRTVEAALTPDRQGVARVAATLGQGAKAEAAAAAARRAGLDLASSVSWPPTRRDLARAPAEPDFVHPLPAPSRRAWWALAAAGALLLAAGLDARDAWQDREGARQTAELELQASRVAVLGSRDAPGSASPSTRTGPRATSTAASASFDLEGTPSGLDYRWDQVFLAAERASLPGMRWLSLDHARAGGELRLEGVSRDERAPARAVAMLRGDPTWDQVLLARQEPLDGGYAFEIAMRRAADRPARAAGPR